MRKKERGGGEFGGERGRDRDRDGDYKRERQRRACAAETALCLAPFGKCRPPSIQDEVSQSRQAQVTKFLIFL